MSGPAAKMGMNNSVVNSGRQEWYDVLGLRRGASPEEIRVAYRDMVKVWHPDRFNSDPRVREKAEAKLKELNEAYQGLLPSASKSDGQSKPQSRPQLKGGPAAPRRLAGFDPFGRESKQAWVPPAGAPGDAGDEPVAAATTPWKKIALVAIPAAIALAAALYFWPAAMSMLSGSSSRPATPVPPAQTAAPTTPPMSPPPASVNQTPAPGSQPPADSPTPQPPTSVGPAPTAPGAPISGQAAEPYNGVIMLVTVRPFRSREYGTAFLVARTKAITASHIVADAAEHRFPLVAVTPDYHAYRAQVVCRSSSSGRRQAQAETAGKDVAVVQIDWDSPVKAVQLDQQSAAPETAVGSFTPLPVSRLGPQPGEKVLIVGYRRQKSGVTQVRQIGVVTDVSRTADGTVVFSGKFPKSLTPGDGGAPVLNRAGEVVGVWAWDAPGDDGGGGGTSVPSLTCP